MNLLWQLTPPRRYLRFFGGDNSGGLLEDLFKKWPLVLATKPPILYGGVYLVTDLNLKLPADCLESSGLDPYLMLVYYPGKINDLGYRSGIGRIFDLLMVAYLPRSRNNSHLAGREAQLVMESRDKHYSKEPTL
ncbi:uncharacterized protein BDR25DRAFT_358410 [Lindgomyces ingoldianus]|uniref:Uncharacterized protein n=1 Tax=Lindgomyces ingoldianus TaxID=673940 RepID=A0ACB6QMB5_9PLEO|nr:uncharacterized protein BDR25DRAFT_358410 [Lindgomyces ingoldianus]KAF2467723.1 hypothetical protein BDR25DRAFT_358410 [Lindgomyces ingoldianus]